MQAAPRVERCQGVCLRVAARLGDPGSWLVHLWSSSPGGNSCIILVFLRSIVSTRPWKKVPGKRYGHPAWPPPKTALISLREHAAPPTTAGVAFLPQTAVRSIFDTPEGRPLSRLSAGLMAATAAIAGACHNGHIDHHVWHTVKQSRQQVH